MGLNVGDGLPGDNVGNGDGPKVGFDETDGTTVDGSKLGASEVGLLDGRAVGI